MKEKLVIGIDYGTDSCRALVINALSGKRWLHIPLFKRWKSGLYCDPSINQYRQHPLDYIESLEVIRGATGNYLPTRLPK